MARDQHVFFGSLQVVSKSLCSGVRLALLGILSSPELSSASSDKHLVVDGDRGFSLLRLTQADKTPITVPLAQPISDAQKLVQQGKELYEVLAHDVFAITDELTPGARLWVISHDNGAFTVYHALAIAPDRFERAVTLTAAHQAAVFSNTSRSP